MITKYYPEEAFDIATNEIKLKKYPSDAIAYLSATSLNLKKGDGIVAPFVQTNVHITDETSYPCISVRYDKKAEGGQLTYHKNNFKSFQYGCIRFSAKKIDCDEDYSYQDVKQFLGCPAGAYTIYIRTTSNGNQDVVHSVLFTLPKATSSVDYLADRIQKAIQKSAAIVPFKCLSISNGIRFYSSYAHGLQTISKLEIYDDKETGFFHTYFDKIEDPVYFCAPDNDSVVFSLKENNTTNNQILFIHKTDGNLYLIMNNEDSSYTFTKKLCKWNWTNEEFTEFELNFDASLCNFLVNGKLISHFEPVGIKENDNTDVNNITRSNNPNTFLTLVGEYNGHQGDGYDYSSIILFNKKQHCGEYIPTDVEEYDGSAYVEYNYGQLTAYDDKSLKIECSGYFKFQMFDGNDCMAQSTDKDEFIKAVKAIDYDDSSTLSFESIKDIKFKITFLQKGSILNSLEFNPGTAIMDPSDPYNFSDIYEWVRRQLGYPNVPVELSDEVIYDNLCEAVYEYNKWRNYDKNLSIEKTTQSETDLRKVSSEKEGTYYILPAGISDKDIIDIYFTPRYSTAWFGAGSDFMNDVMAQTFFSKANDMSTNAADYYIYRTSLNDISTLLGTHISWRIYNNHLYITPNNLDALDLYKIGIVYRQPLSIEEIRNSYQIRRYCLGKSMIVLGNIRGTFGNSIPVGDLSIQMNSDTLIANGKEIVADALTTMHKESYPLFLIW